MSHRGRSALAAVALVLVVFVGWIALGRQPGVPTATMLHAPNELDIDLAAGTPMPPLPTAVPEGWSITTAEQALVRGMQEVYPAPQPDAVSVRLVNNGIMNTLCGADGGGLMPEDGLVWAVAYVQSGLDMKEVRGPWYDRGGPPMPFLTTESSPPTSTPVPSRTPEPVAGVLVYINAVEGFAQFPDGLFDPDAPGSRCPSFAMIRAMRSFPDILKARPTEDVTPIPTMGIDAFMMEGITDTADITATYSITDGP